MVMEAPCAVVGQAPPDSIHTSVRLATAPHLFRMGRAFFFVFWRPQAFRSTATKITGWAKCRKSTTNGESRSRVNQIAKTEQQSGRAQSHTMECACSAPDKRISNGIRMVLEHLFFYSHCNGNIPIQMHSLPSIVLICLFFFIYEIGTL